MTIRAPLPWIFEEVTHLGGSQSYRVLSSVPHSNGESYGMGNDDEGKYPDRLIFHDLDYYSMAPNTDDAAFIVRACNLHHELLDALMLARKIITQSGMAGDFASIDAAINKAGEA